MSLIDQLVTLVQQQGADIKALNDALAAKMDKDRITGQDIFLDFPSIAANSNSELTITVQGAVTTDVALLALSTNINAGVILVPRISATNTLRVRCYNTTAAAIDPINGTYRLRLLKLPT